MSAEDTAAAFTEFQAALARARHPLIGALRPGLARDDIRSQTTAAGIRLTDDAVELWGWHDGVDPDLIEPPRIPRSWSLPGGPYFLPLGDALRDYAWLLNNFPFSDLDDWSTTWFPAFTYSHGNT